MNLPDGAPHRANQPTLQLKRTFVALRIGLILALGGAVTLWGGWIQGKLTNRWGPPSGMSAAVAMLQQLPARIGEWRLLEAAPLTPHELNRLQCAGHINRTYENPSTSETVTATILLGPPGPISVHTPEMCYSSKQYSLEGRRQRIQIRPEQAPGESFWSVRFRSHNAARDEFRVVFAWSDGNRWLAPQEPRIRFGGRPYLYKLQIAAPASGDGEQNDACSQFMKAFLPVAERSMLPYGAEPEVTPASP